MSEIDTTSADELQDTEEAADFDWRSLDPALLTSPPVLRALTVVVVASLVLLWPNRSGLILGRLLGLGSTLLGLSALRAGISGRGYGRFSLVGGLLAVAGGIYVLLNPELSDDLLATLAGCAMAFVAVRDLFLVRRAESEAPGWVITRSLALLAVAALLVLFSAQLFSAFIAIVAVSWLLVSFVVIIASLDPSTAGTISYTDSVQIISDWVGSRPKSVDDRQSLYAKIFYEGAVTQKRLVRFFALMGFASVIASTGVIADSTAVVIGAMLIAPLMTPLMGMAISLVMGWPRRLARSALIAVSGIAFAITIGLLVGLFSPAIIETTVNSQIVARSSPTILDLVTAMAAGAAGAYGLSRPDVSDSLPGVAIAISLVPPLTVVGIALSQGDWGSATGALLLFTTNMLAILIVGGTTFVLTGITPVKQVAENQHRVRTWLGAVAGVAAVVLGALLLNGAEIASTAAQQSTIESSVSDWLGDGEHEVVRIVPDGDRVSVTVIGPSEGLAETQQLATSLASTLDRAITVDVRLVVEERDQAQAEP